MGLLSAMQSVPAWELHLELEMGLRTVLTWDQPMELHLALMSALLLAWPRGAELETPTALQLGLELEHESESQLGRLCKIGDSDLGMQSQDPRCNRQWHK